MVATAQGRFAMILLLAATMNACGDSPQSPRNAARTSGMPDASEEISTERSVESPYVTGQPAVAPEREATPVSPVPPATGGSEVPVTLSEYRIDMPNTLPAGPTTFRIMNTGTLEHSFEIEGNALERRLDTVLKPGENRPLTIDLKPGTFKVYCPVGTHSDQGMALTVTVTESAQPPAAP